MTNTTQLTARRLRKSYGERLLLDDVSFSIRPGERAGIVGENGAGKSTLLRLLAGLETPDDGEVIAQANGIGHLAQVTALPPEATVTAAIDAALAELRAMESRLRELETDLGASAALAEYGDLLTAFELRGGYESDARVDKAIHHLGLAHLDRHRTLGSLSGGELARLGLACLLAAAPELMLLDEPTNHLDDQALDWLEDQLRTHPGTIVLVSHDRVFLDRVATVILEVDADQAKVTRYGQDYSGYLAERAAARRRWEQDFATWCEDIRQLTVSATVTAHRVAPGRAIKDGNKMAYDRDAGRVQSSISSRVRNAQERLRRLQETPVPRPPDPLTFTTALTGGTTGDLLTLQGIRVANRLHIDTLTIAAQDRLLIHGPNGAGKSTLLRILAADLTPDAGQVHRKGRIGYLPQEIPTPHPHATLLAAYAQGRPGLPEDHTNPLLTLGLFRPQDLHVPVGALSTGQRRRLALSRLLTQPWDLLLLDEPTNHLALSLVEDLEQALSQFPGAVVIVSHDRRLRANFTGTQRELIAGRLTAGGSAD
ncbi:ribosomal protection-like ABC-F family protein [Crossiella cryophila]|uniref:Macrolide transport system ATP-binding/permease protein n=1 Tax=Crossiella cryophila TaxID=43355 RepID=A0A7W7FTC1_9PSEU|nr:ABC-F family ATP-binding cassette domain-containing protein [Crossiella cryophila]MBB4676850.1 macrolide transport system ATP-binding/permease protein [Crossiella cryophila]